MKPAHHDVPFWKDRPRAVLFGKRTLDLCIGVPLLVVSLPLQFMIALWIRLDSPGPALFRQQRLSLEEGSFILYKFRTMYADARERFPELYDYAAIAEQDGAVPLKQKGDPRLTRFGAWLRRTSLDELPNLWNVVRGEMSLVGPRPEIPELLPCYGPKEKQIFQVKPGLTGLPQVTGRNTLAVAETLELDLIYARRASLSFDCWILLRTIPRVVDFRDAY